MRMWTLGMILLACALGVMIAAHEGAYGFSFDPKIKPFEVLTLTVNIFIAIFLQYYLAGRARDSREEKDILIANVKEIVQQLRDCRKIVSACQDGNRIPEAQQKEIHAALRNMSNELHNVEFVLDASNCKDMTERCRLLLLDLQAYKAAVTGGNFPAPYTKSQISSEIRAFRTLHRSLPSLVFDINRHS